MNALGVVGLVVGLWLVAPGARILGRDTAFAVLGWTLIAVAGLLVLTSVLAMPATPSSDQNRVSSGAPTPGRQHQPGYLVPAEPTPTGADAPS